MIPPIMLRLYFLHTCPSIHSQGWISLLLSFAALVIISFLFCKMLWSGWSLVKATPWFHGSSFLGFAHLVHRMDSKWDFKSSFHCLHSVGLPVWNAWLGNSINCPNLHGRWQQRDSNCYPADGSVTKGPLGADTDTCFTLDLWFSRQLHQ